MPCICNNKGRRAHDSTAADAVPPTVGRPFALTFNFFTNDLRCRGKVDEAETFEDRFANEPEGPADVAKGLPERDLAKADDGVEASVTLLGASLCSFFTSLR